MPNGEGLFHLHVGWISRGDGRDVVAAAAYRAAARLENSRKGQASDFTHKSDRTLHSEIVLPPGSPSWAEDRARLWNEVESRERRGDSRLAAEIEFAIPYGVPRKEWERLGREMAQLYAADGHAVDFSLHLGEDGTNPHIHMLLSTRRLTEDGFAKTKIAGMDKRAFVVAARKRWEQVANHWLAVSGSRERIDHRSYMARGMDRTPGQHVRPDPVERARKREIGQMVRGKEFMQRKPTNAEKSLYPNLTAREKWPPEFLYPTHDMDAQERKELAAYREELQQDRLEPVISKVEHDYYLRSEYSEQALYESDVRASIAAREQQRDEDAEMRKRAVGMFRTKDENERLKAARAAGSKERYQSEEEKIIRERIAFLEKKDRADYVREFDSELYSRAMALGRTKDEHQRLEAARASGVRDGRKIMEEQIIRERMAFLKEKDQLESNREIEAQERKFWKDKERDERQGR